MGKSKQKKNKVILPPELPPDVPEDEIEVSDEDLEYVIQNPDYAGLVSKLDTPSINRHVIRAADVKEDALESLYERQQRKKSQVKEKEDVGIEVDPVDALPVKTLDGKLYYRTASKVPKESATAENEDEAIGENEGDAEDKGGLKLTKAERRAKLKKLKKETKKQKKGGMEVEEVQQTPQDAVLAEVQKDLTVEEASEQMKFRLAELGTALLMDPEANIKTLKEMLQITKDGDHAIVVLGMKSLLAVFKDIIPGYRVRLPTDKEQEMVVSKAVKKMRFYESTLLSSYKAFLQKLMALERQASFQRVAARCICTLLESVPHFNFRESLLAAVIKNISSSDDVVRKYCCGAIKSLFTNEGKHSGEATVEAVQLIANLVKSHDCQLHPDSIEVFLSLSFDEDLGRPENSKVDKKVKSKKHFKIFKKGKRGAEPSQLPDERKKSKQELMSKTRDEVNADFKAASFTLDVEERKRMQSDILSYVFQTYFRILKHTMQSRSEPSSGVTAGAFADHPLLAPCLSGLGKFAHLIDMDFMADLMKSLRILAGGQDAADKSLGNGSNHLTVSERLRCCIVAFKVMKKNLDALNVDLQDFFVQLYNLIYEYSTGRDEGEVLAEALKIMLCDDRQHDMQRAAAFIKRLATFALYSGSAESMAALVTLKHLLQKNAKCRNLLENDAGGGSLSGPIAKYQPYASDPHLSGALASVLWELNILSKHYHPRVATMASTILTLSSEQTQIYHANVSPQQAYLEMCVEKESLNLVKSVPNSKNNKRKRGNGLPPAAANVVGLNLDIPRPTTDENEEVRKKLSEHFLLVGDMTENERLRAELETTKLSLELYQEYNKQKKKKKSSK